MQIFIQLAFSLSLIGMIINLVIGYLQLGAPQFYTIHLVIGLASTFIGVFVTQISMSYFLGTRDQLVEQDRFTKMDPQIIEEAKKVKKALFSSCGPAMIVLLLNATFAGCTYAQVLPPLPHHILAYLSLMSLARAFKATVQFHRFRPKLFES